MDLMPDNRRTPRTKEALAFERWVEMNTDVELTEWQIELSRRVLAGEDVFSRPRHSCFWVMPCIQSFRSQVPLRFGVEGIKPALVLVDGVRRLEVAA